MEEDRIQRRQEDEAELAEMRHEYEAELAEMRHEANRLAAAVARKEREARLTPDLPWKRYGF